MTQYCEVATLNPDEDQAASEMNPDNPSVAESSGWFVNGYITSNGSTNSTTQECVVRHYDAAVTEYKDTTAYKSAFGGSITGVVGGVALLAGSIYLARKLHLSGRGSNNNYGV